VSLSRGSLAVMSSDAAAVDQLTALVRESILPTAKNSA